MISPAFAAAPPSYKIRSRILLPRHQDPADPLFFASGFGRNPSSRLSHALLHAVSPPSFPPFRQASTEPSPAAFEASGHRLFAAAAPLCSCFAAHWRHPAPIVAAPYYGSTPLRSRERLTTRSSMSTNEIQLQIDPMHGDLDEQITGLHSKIRLLKGVAQLIESEAKFQNDFISQLQMTLIKVQAGVKNSIKRMDASSLNMLQFHSWDYSNPRYLDALKHLADLKGQEVR